MSPLTKYELLEFCLLEGGAGRGRGLWAMGRYLRHPIGLIRGKAAPLERSIPCNSSICSSDTPIRIIERNDCGRKRDSFILFKGN